MTKHVHGTLYYARITNDHQQPAEVQKLALEDGAAVLITGGFNTTAEIAKLADDL